MTSLYWTYVFLILLGTVGDTQSQTCTKEYLLKANQCLLSFLEAVASEQNDITSSGYNTVITSQFLLMKIICESPEHLGTFICAVNGINVCGEAFDIHRSIRLALSKYNEALINEMCGYLPVLEQNLSCLNGLENSSTFDVCLTPAYYGSQGGMEFSCRFEFATAACSLNEVETMCPAFNDAYQGALQIYPDPYCHIELCLLEYGDCGGKFRHDMPMEAVQRKGADFVAYSHAIQYICGSGKPYVECMTNGTICASFNTLMTFPGMFGILLEPASFLVNYGCKDINTLTSKFWCLNDHFASGIFQECIYQVFAKSSSVPETPYDVMPCGIYQGAANCMKSIAKRCGQEVVDYYIKWSPAVFLLAQGCGSWKVSSAISVNMNTTLLLIQLSVALLFLLKN